MPGIVHVLQGVFCFVLSELGERGRDVSAKDLVSSIISAANKKIRKKDKAYKSSDSVDVDADSEVSYNERNIDREVELRRIREITQPATALQKEESSSSLEVSLTSSASMTFSQTLTQSKSSIGDHSNSVYSAKMAYHVQRKDSEVSIQPTAVVPAAAAPPPPAAAEEAARQLTVTHYPAYQPPELTSYATENAKPTLLRRFSEDYLNERKSAEHDEVNHQPLGRGTQFTRRAQFQLDTLQKEKQELRQKEEEKKREQLRHATARKRIELELQKTREELERDEAVEDILSKKCDYINRSKADTRSVTSDYSTMSSTGGYPGSLSAAPPSVHISRSSSSLLTHTAEEVTRKRGEPRRRRLQRGTAEHPAAHDDLELYMHHTGAARSAALDTSRVVGRGTLTRMKPQETDPSQDGSWQDYHKQGLPQPRRNSLDSMRDFYQHEVAESDPDDLVHSLTSTFDKKMKFLTETPGPQSWEQASPLGSFRKHCVEANGEGLYRDPSLHRTNHRGELQVGIASRFERNTDSKSITKSEKTDANLSKQKGQETTAADYVDALRRSTERLYGSRERLSELSLPKQAAELQSPTRHTPKHKDTSGRKAKRRRHTVGGTNDLEHFKALIDATNHCKSAQRDRASAWDRLQPAVRAETDARTSRDVQAWLQQQHRMRHAGSSPALLDPTLQLQQLRQHRMAAASSSQSPSRESPPSGPSSPLFSAPIAGRSHTFTFESSIWMNEWMSEWTLPGGHQALLPLTVSYYFMYSHLVVSWLCDKYCSDSFSEIPGNFLVISLQLFVLLVCRVISKASRKSAIVDRGMMFVSVAHTMLYCVNFQLLISELYFSCSVLSACGRFVTVSWLPF